MVAEHVQRQAEGDGSFNRTANNWNIGGKKRRSDLPPVVSRDECLSDRLALAVRLQSRRDRIENHPTD